MSERTVAMVTLRALEGEPLADRRVRDMVLATARAVAERSGVSLVRVDADSSSVRAILAAEQVVALGFAAELRRITNEWHELKFGGAPLWGAAPRAVDPLDAPPAGESSDSPIDESELPP